MNLPFGLPAMKESGARKKEDNYETAAQFERKLAEYREVLETYKRLVKDYSNRFDEFERRFKDNQRANVQTAMDLTYIKEQGDKAAEILYQLKAVSNNRPYGNLDQITEAIESLKGKLDIRDKSLHAIDEGLNNYGKNILTMAINIDSMDKHIESLKQNVDSLDKNVVNRLSEFLLELQKQHIYQNRQLQTEVLNDVEKLKEEGRKNRTILWFILIFNFFGLCTMAFMALYYLEIIPL